MNWYNYGVGGGTVTAELYYPAKDGQPPKPRHWVSRNIDKIHECHPVLDYLILEGGTNDADLLAPTPERIGSLDPCDYNGNYDDSTFTGALEVCKKWGIPYIDLWERTPLNPSLKCYYNASLSPEENIDLGKAYNDGQHLTAVGYALVTPAIESFIASL